MTSLQNDIRHVHTLVMKVQMCIYFTFRMILDVFPFIWHMVIRRMVPESWGLEKIVSPPFEMTVSLCDLDLVT